MLSRLAREARVRAVPRLQRPRLRQPELRLWAGAPFRGVSAVSLISSPTTGGGVVGKGFDDRPADHVLP